MENRYEEHIIPYLEFAINYYKGTVAIDLISRELHIPGMCTLTSMYSKQINLRYGWQALDISRFLDKWLVNIRPIKTLDNGMYWWSPWTHEGRLQRIEFLQTQSNKLKP